MKIRARSGNILFTLSAIGLLMGLGVAPAANSALLTGVTIGGQTGSPFEGNDCSGLLGQGFENCEYADSPIVIKFNYDNGVLVESTVDEPNPEINSMFSSIDGSEFLIVFNSGTDGVGTWYYQQGDGDPLITHYTAKGANSFNLYDMTGNLGCSLALGGVTYTQCATWSTPTGQGLSHLGFYDSDGGGNPNVNPTPEPGVLLLMGAGLLGLGMARRRKSA